MVEPIDISDAHPEFGAKVRELEIKAISVALNPVKTAGARGFAHQARLVAAWHAWDRAGRVGPAPYGMVSAPAPMGETRHHPFFEGKCAAFDILAYPGCNIHGPDQGKLIFIARSIGIKCGADWGDMVHFEAATIGGVPVDPYSQIERIGKLLDRQSGFLDNGA